MSADGDAWFVVNASPDLRQQIAQTPVLHPRSGGRSSPIHGVVLTGGEVDTLAGLLTLRERQAFNIFATASVMTILQRNPIFNVLSDDVVRRVTVILDQDGPLLGVDDAMSGLTCEWFPVPGKVPLYMEGVGESAGEPETISDGTTTGARLTAGDKTLFYIPGCAALSPPLAERLRGADCVLFDGTLWRDDEMLVAGVGTKTGRRMGHMSVSGPGGVIEAFKTLDVKRKILIHINNTNPILLDDSPEHAATRDAGWEIAWDGMELVL